MKTIKTDIIPSRQSFVKIDAPSELNYEAICVFAALGFFLDQDTYFKNEICLRPASSHTVNDKGIVVKSESYFQWYHTPKDINFEEALDGFTSLFESIIDQQVQDKGVILPLSGGLDSRTQAAALYHLNKKVESYSYSFENGYNEAKISKKIADVCGFSFEGFQISRGYLWDHIEDLAKINGCYAEFTHARQMAVINSLASKGDLFSLGHWGDVLFDNITDEQLSSSEEISLILKKIVKPGGLHLANLLWKSWSLEGDFSDYLRARIESLMSEIDIQYSNAKIRAFKSMYWAPRWTTANLSVFESVQPISLPYYHNDMCEFICTVPEAFLADRQLQIAYIKKRSKALSNIVWQEQKPFNLNNYRYNRSPYNLPYRVLNKLKRTWDSSIGKSYVQRNWELQFTGTENSDKLESYIYAGTFKQLISQDIVDDIYSNFNKIDALKFSHPLSILLTLSLWQQNNNSL